MQPEFPEFEGQQFRHQLTAPTSAPEESALCKLLGQDFEKFINEHLDAYNEAKKKWSECSIEEWRAGGEGG